MFRQLLLERAKLSFHLCHASRLLYLFSLEWLKQIVHILTYLVLDFVPLELSDFD